MVRTKENAGLKVGAKAPRKGLSGPSTSAASPTSAKKPRDDSGGNPVCPRETPAWQKPITDFFRQQSTSKMEEDVPTSDGSEADGSSKENVNPEENRDTKSTSSPNGSTENKPGQTTEPEDDVEKSDVGDNEGEGDTVVDTSSAGSSKE